MSITFEWDPKKAASNVEKHGVTFEESSTIFGDYFSLTILDPDHSEQEERYITLGRSFKDRILVVSHTDREDRIRIISARKATKKEIEDYNNK